MMLAMRRAFTLVEVVVALAIGGVVVAAAYSLLVGIGEERERLSRFAVTADRGGAGERLLRAIIGRLEPDSSASGSLSGNDSAVRFTSWCDTADGWQERCKVLIGVTTVSERRAIVVVLEDRDTIGVVDKVTTAAFRYLLSARGGGTWYSAWPPGISLPIALGLIVDGDTNVIRIGERR